MQGAARRTREARPPAEPTFPTGAPWKRPPSFFVRALERAGAMPARTSSGVVQASSPRVFGRRRCRLPAASNRTGSAGARPARTSSGVVQASAPVCSAAGVAGFPLRPTEPARRAQGPPGLRPALFRQAPPCVRPPALPASRCVQPNRLGGRKARPDFVRPRSGKRPRVFGRRRCRLPAASNRTGSASARPARTSSGLVQASAPVCSAAGVAGFPLRPTEPARRAQGPPGLRPASFRQAPPCVRPPALPASRCVQPNRLGGRKARLTHCPARLRRERRVDTTRPTSHLRLLRSLCNPILICVHLRHLWPILFLLCSSLCPWCPWCPWW